MRENVFEKYPGADVSASIVWIPILDEDTLAAAIPSAMLLSDKRIQHFYDSNQRVGRNIAASVGWSGSIAWDTYLLYGPLAEWTETPPRPEYWMHQLKDDWATKNKYRTGRDLETELFVSMKKLLEG